MLLLLQQATCQQNKTVKNAAATPTPPPPPSATPPNGGKNLSFHNENDKQKQKTLSNQDKHLREGERKGARVSESAGGRRRSSNCHLFAITTSWLCA